MKNQMQKEFIDFKIELSQFLKEFYLKQNENLTKKEKFDELK